MRLNIPDIRQTAGHDCGDTGVAAVCALLRVRPPARTSNPVQGMSPDMVEAAFRAVGLPVLSGRMIVEDLRHFTRTGRPVMCPVTDEDDCGHWVVVAGVERGYVHFHCPTDGPSKWKVKTWEAGWRDQYARSGHVYDSWGITVG